MRISDWSSDVCSSDLLPGRPRAPVADFQARALGIGQDADQRVDVAMIVGGIERARNVALQSLRQRDQPRELRQRQRLFQPRPRALGSEARRVGKECVSTARSRWAPAHSNKNNNDNKYE